MKLDTPTVSLTSSPTWNPKNKYLKAKSCELDNFRPFFEFSTIQYICHVEDLLYKFGKSLLASWCSRCRRVGAVDVHGAQDDVCDTKIP